jgi:phytoene dehydrogenase-like protein
VSYDVIVVGAGHNGLVCASLLARSGRKVLLAERRDIVGGLCAGEEFHPGYRHAGFWTDTSGLRPWVVESLQLSKHGLTFDSKWPKIFSPGDPGDGVCVSCGPDGKSRLEPADLQKWEALLAFAARLRPVIEPLVNEPPPDLAHAGTIETLRLLRHGWAARRLGKRDMMELLRIPPMCVADWLREWLPSEHLCAVMAHTAILGTWMGPWSPGSAANLLLYLATLQKPVAGGADALVRALGSSARANGVEIRTQAKVARFTVAGDTVTGVQLEDGETLAASAVVATCDPRQVFQSMLPRRLLGTQLESRIAHYRMRGTTARVNLALKGDVNWSSAHGSQAHYIRTGAHVDTIERAFDAVKYRRCSERPVLDMHMPTRAQADLAPAGCHVLCIQVHFAPYALEGGWTDAAKKRLSESVLTELSRFAPGIRDLVAGSEVLTPVDLETRYGLTGGHPHHGEHALDQLLTRPLPEAFRYATPFPGLYLGGSGTHPGGGVTGAPGALAARELLKS